MRTTPTPFTAPCRSITGGFFDGKTTAAERQRYLLDIIHASSSSTGQQGPSGGSRGCEGPSSGAGGGGAGSACGRDSSGGSGAAPSELSEEELNQLLARDEAELALYAEEGRQRGMGELTSWQAALSKGKLPAGNAAPAATAGGTPAPVVGGKGSRGGRTKGAGKGDGGAAAAAGTDPAAAAGAGGVPYSRLAGEEEVAPLAAAAWRQAAPPDEDEGGPDLLLFERVYQDPGPPELH